MKKIGVFIFPVIFLAGCGGCIYMSIYHPNVSLFGEHDDDETQEVSPRRLYHIPDTVEYKDSIYVISSKIDTAYKHIYKSK